MTAIEYFHCWKNFPQMIYSALLTAICYVTTFPIIDFSSDYNNSVTRNYFENLVRALENGLSDVDSLGTCSKTSSSKSTGGCRSKGGKGKMSAFRGSGSSRNIDDTDHWSCEHCTFANVKSATFCQMCQQRR